MNAFHMLAAVTAIADLKTQAARVGKIKSLSDDTEFRSFLQYALDPDITYGITEKQLPNPKHPKSWDIPASNSLLGMFTLLDLLGGRELTGDNAKEWISNWLYTADPELRVLFRMVIARQLPGSVGVTLVNKAIPGLIYQQPYGGCVAWDPDKAETSFPWRSGVILQPKEDGLALLIDASHPASYRTRQGQNVTAALEHHLQRFTESMPYRHVAFCELRLWTHASTPYGPLVPRAEANGIFNSMFRGETDIPSSRIRLVVLDVIPAHDFYAGKSSQRYLDRYATGVQAVRNYGLTFIAPNGHADVSMVDSRLVYDLQEARRITQQFIATGGEGSVIKHPTAGWYSGKMTHQMKLKNEFETTLVVTAIKPHSKRPEWVGSLLMESSDGKISTWVGSGLNEAGSDLDRRKPSNFPIGSLFEVRAEKISKHNALDLPRLVCPRFDKDYADSYQEVLDAYQASRGAAG